MVMSVVRGAKPSEAKGSFRQISELPPLYERVRRKHLTMLTEEKLLRIEAALRGVRANNVDGDYVEFGIALGGTSIAIANRARKAKKRFVGFDVFGMIPAPDSENDDEKSLKRYEVIASGKAGGIGGKAYYGYEEDLLRKVTLSLAAFDLPLRKGKIELVKGLFEETLPKSDIETIAFAHIDCDWYDPVKCCLEFVAPRLEPKGLVVIDDYFHFGGCRKAVNEFLAGHPEFCIEVSGMNPVMMHHQVGRKSAVMGALKAVFSRRA